MPLRRHSSRKASPVLAFAVSEAASAAFWHTAQMQPLFRVHKLVNRFNGATVVDDLSFELRRGECLGVIGPNGAGKTTTIRMCLGLTSPQSGEIAIFGLPIPFQVREAKKRIGVVTQFDSL